MNLSFLLWSAIMTDTVNLNKEYFEYVGTRLTVIYP
jgi:hypothetical protein